MIFAFRENKAHAKKQKQKQTLKRYQNMILHPTRRKNSKSLRVIF